MASPLCPGPDGCDELWEMIVPPATAKSLKFSYFIGTNATINFRDAAATNYSDRFYRAVIP